MHELLDTVVLELQGMTRDLLRLQDVLSADDGPIAAVWAMPEAKAAPVIVALQDLDRLTQVSESLATLCGILADERRSDGGTLLMSEARGTHPGSC
ncbi:MAG: hypothetical protein DI498_09225 [Paracoccus denitrificans]|nr:MAG: hypothetical protein DI498_09225 [Paracoccus denitrificans]PZO84059.1 MAG: hypothetical protein DI633_09225 [Paracoccus denitrificans]